MHPISKIKKRNSQIVDFEIEKISKSLKNAFLRAKITQTKTNQKNEKFLLEQITEKILMYLNIFAPLENVTLANSIITTSQVKALVTNILNEQGYNSIASAYNNYSKTKSENTILENLSFSEDALKFIEKNYLQTNDQNTLTFKDFFEDVAEKLADNKEKAFFYDCLIKKHFLPNHNFLKKSSAIEKIYLTIEDKLENIFESLTSCALHYQKGISVQLNFSELRPKNSTISSQNKLASGPISFMKVYTTTFEALKEGNVTNINQTISLNIQHPDIIEFILFAKFHSKNSNLKFIIQVDQNFLDAVKRNLSYQLIHPQTKKVLNSLNSRSIFDLIINAIRENNNLGIELAEKNQEEANINKNAIISGFINLSSMTDENEFNFSLLKKVIKIAAQALRKMAQTENLDLKKTLYLYLNGYAEMLIKLNIKYNSVQSLQLTEKILNQIKNETPQEIKTAVNIDTEIFTLWNTIPGIEPLAYLGNIKRNLQGNESYSIHPLLEQKLQEENIEISGQLKNLIETNSLENIDNIPEKLKNIFLTAKQIDPYWHVKIQALFEEHLTGTVHKKIYLGQTINLEDMKDLYLEAFQSGCTNITNLEMEKIEDFSQDDNGSPEKKFLLNINHLKKVSKKIQFQPQLFALKKTEEVSIPPINSILN